MAPETSSSNSRSLEGMSYAEQYDSIFSRELDVKKVRASHTCYCFL